MKNYSYPRVETSVKALNRARTAPEAEDTTVLFVPIISPKGPEKKLYKIHSLEEYESVFGTDERMGLTLLNISNWLTAGGTLYTYRMVGANATPTKFGLYYAGELTEEKTYLEVEGKYDGTYLNDFNCRTYVKLTNENKSGVITVELRTKTNVLVERVNAVIPDFEKLGDASREGRYPTIDEKYNSQGSEPENDFAERIAKGRRVIDLSKKSEYLKSVTVMFAVKNANGSTAIKNLYFINGETKAETAIDGYDVSDVSEVKSLTPKPGTDDYTDYETPLAAFWKYNDSNNSSNNNSNNNSSNNNSSNNSSNNNSNDSSDDNSKGYSNDLIAAIGNPIESPIDLIMDANYSAAIKKDMIKCISSVDDASGDINALRPDINGIFDLSDVAFTNLNETAIKQDYFGSKDCYKETKNIFFFAQSFVISEEVYFDKELTVGASYFLSRLIPANDLGNGIQFPVAGKRRGELEGVKSISFNPTPDEKDDLFKARINYVEKDSRGYYFMSQRTFDGSSEDSYTALSFMNNARVTCKMVHELEKLGREYLFEFNDAITLANLSAVLNRYVTNWISNRTLSYGNVVVSADQYSDEKVNVTLNIKFTGTIEVISIDLVLE